MSKILLMIMLASCSLFSQKISIESRCEYTLSDTISEECQDNILERNDSAFYVKLRRDYMQVYTYAEINFTPFSNRIYQIKMQKELKNDKDFLRENLKWEYRSRLFKLEDTLGKFEATKFNGTVNDGSEIIYDYQKKIVSEKYPDTVYARITLQLFDGSFLISEKYVDFGLKYVWLPKERELVKLQEDYREEEAKKAEEWRQENPTENLLNGFEED